MGRFVFACWPENSARFAVGRRRATWHNGRLRARRRNVGQRGGRVAAWCVLVVFERERVVGARSGRGWHEIPSRASGDGIIGKLARASRALGEDSFGYPFRPFVPLDLS